ncbi:TonB-dependent receptor, partial [bacterium]|nr:TonB-dependent receptor [bacterium]
MKRIELIVVILGSLLTVFSAQAARPDRGMVEGQIRDARTGERLPGANVQILETLLGASADLHGKFRIRSIRPGNYTFKFSMIGYEPLLREGVAIEAGRSSSLAVKLNQTVLGMNPVVVTASKRRQDLTLTPHSISVLSGTEINERQPVRLDEALQTVSGVQFVENSISIRGSSGYTKGIGSRVLLLIDGVPLMLADTGEINWNLLPIMGIEQVEVIKGAGSALYGSNALGGVINVITRAPTREGNVQVRTMFGLYDQPFYPEWKWTNKPLSFFQVQAGVGKTFQFQPLPKAVQYALLPFWFWPWRSDVEDLGLQITVNQEQSTGYREQNAFSQYNFVLRSDHIFSDGAKFTMYGGFSYEDREEFIEWENSNKPLNISCWWDGRETRFRTLDAYLMYRKPLSSTAALRFRVSFISSLMADQYERSGDYQPANGTGGEVTFDWLPRPNHSLTGGIEVKTDGGHTKFIGNRRGWSISPYFQDEWHLSKKLTITPGFRYDSYQIQDTNFQEDQFSPKFGLNYVLGPKTAFRASAGSSFRAASVTERFISAKFTYFPIIPNENLKAETAWSFDLGLN